MRRVTSSLTGLVLVAGLVWVGPANAGDTCTFNENTHTVNTGAPEDDESLTIIRNGNAIEVEESNCGDATVNNTDRIVIDATSSAVQVNIHVGDGPFRPGFTGEPGDSDEIEFELDFNDNDSLLVIGGEGPFNVRLGSGATQDPVTRINLNAGESPAEGNEGVDADVVVDRLTDVNLISHSVTGLGDELVAEGGLATGDIWPRRVGLYGGVGDDVLVGGLGPDVIHGGAGVDVLNGSAGRDRLKGAHGNDDLSGGKGRDRIGGHTGTDRVQGGLGADVVIGGPGADVLGGGVGADLMRGMDGTDDISGGDGDDELFGDDHPDQLDGGSGSDFCDGGAEDDDYKDCETER